MSRAESGRGYAGRCRGAFTLIELLVVIAIISLLIGILLPSLGAARQSARDLACLANERSMGQGFAIYESSNRGFIPGPNTSGLELHQGGEYGGAPSSPTQDWDFISPIVGDMLALPGEDRLLKYERMLQTDMSCPSNREEYALLYDGPEVPLDEDVQGEGPHPRIISYTVSAYFMLIADYNPDRTFSDSSEGEFAKLWDRGAPYPVPADALRSYGVALRRGYRPNVDNLGFPAAKVFAFEGGRYFDSSLRAGRGGLDYATVLDTSGFSGRPQGNFTAVGPTFTGNGGSGMGGMGRDSNGVPNDYFKDVFLRHSGDTMAMVYFDGSAKLLNDREAADPALYAPSGSRVFSNSNFLPEYAEKYEKDAELP